MKNVNRMKLILWGVLMLVACNMQAQVTFMLKDSLTAEPLPDAVVSLYSQEKVLFSTVTTSKGNCTFRLPKEATLMKISRINYTTKTLRVNSSIAFPQLILLSPRVLKEVVVTGDAETHDIDKDGYLVTDSLRKGTAFAADLLGKLPGVMYDWFENSVSVYGQKNILLLVDGMEKSQDYIKNMNPQRIKKVEISHNPGGRYLSDNYAAIINLLLYEDYVGWDMLLTNETRVKPDKLDASDWLMDEKPGVDFTYTRNRTTIHAGYDYERKRINVLEEKYSSYPGIIENQTISNGDKDANVGVSADNHVLVAGLDYQIAKRHTLSFQAQHSMDYKNVYEDNLLRSRKWGSDVMEIRQWGHREERPKDYVVALFYQGSIGERWKLYSDLNYNYYRNKSDIEANQENWYSVRNSYDGKKNYIRFNADATYAFNDRATLKLGYNTTWKEYRLDNRQINEEVSSSENYRNRLFAYYSHTFDQHWRLSIGTGFEWIDYKNQDRQSSDFAVFPDVKVMFIPNKDLNMVLQYQSSVDYPTLYQTIPGIYSTDSVLYYQGNPNLKQAVHHNLSLRVRLLNCLTITPTYRLVRGAIDDYYSQPKQGQVSLMSVNTDARDYGANVGFDKLFWNRFYVSANVAFNRTKLHYNEIDKGVNTWKGNAMFMYINQKTALRFLLQYNHQYGKRITLQGEGEGGDSMLMLGLMKNYFKNRLSVMAMYVCPFTWDKFKYSKNSINTDFLQLHVRNDNFNQLKNMVMLRVNYRFSKGKRTKKVENVITTDKE